MDILVAMPKRQRPFMLDRSYDLSRVGYAHKQRLTKMFLENEWLIYFIFSEFKQYGAGVAVYIYSSERRVQNFFIIDVR